MYQPASSGIYYYHTDPAGTPLAVTNTSGAVVWKGYYEPFGNEYAIQGTIGNDVRFAGNKKDDETGLNYFGARYMDSALGRFRAPDPVGPVDSKTGKIDFKILTEPQGLNAFSYARNNPINRIDPFGLRDILIVIWNRDFMSRHSVGHATALEMNGSVILSQFPDPQGAKGANVTLDWQQTVAREGRDPDRIFKVYVPNDSGFDDIVRDRVSRDSWDWLPSNRHETNCIESVESALRGGGVPVGSYIWPGSLGDDLQDKSGERRNGQLWSVSPAGSQALPGGTP